MHKYKSYYEYRTVEGDRLDQIAHKFYGTPWLYQPIVEVNPQVISKPLLPRGMALRIPVIERQNWVDPNSLPPWRRGNNTDYRYMGG